MIEYSLPIFPPIPTECPHPKICLYLVNSQFLIEQGTKAVEVFLDESSLSLKNLSYHAYLCEQLNGKNCQGRAENQMAFFEAVESNESKD